MIQMQKLIAARQLKQREAEDILRVSQPRSATFCGAASNCSVLMR
jgi:predicted XRE-type DNA-binding protein